MQKKVNSGKRSNKNQTERFLELFSLTLNFFAPKRYENVIVYFCFDSTRLFQPNAQCHSQGLNKSFLQCALCFCIIIISYLVVFMYIINT